jgi:hypothetical protein
MTVTVTTHGGIAIAKVVFKKGPDPKPESRDGSRCRSCWMMGTNPYYSPTAHDQWIDRPKLSTWQKVALGIITVLSTAVIAAPAVMAVGEGCLAAAPVCAAEIAEMATGGASGGSLTVGSALAAGGNAADASVGSLSKLPGSAGIAVPGRLSNEMMAALSKEHSVEFALVYRAGPGKNGGGGSYWLYSGRTAGVRVPVGPDVRVINHTHPGGTPYASTPDGRMLAALQQSGSPQRSSEVVLPDGSTIRFGGDWTRDGTFTRGD